MIQEFSHETQPLQEFCSKISLENLHKSSLSVCSKCANPRNSQCRQTLGKSTHTPHHVLVWLLLCAFWVMSLWFHIPHHTFPVNNTNNISLLTTKVPLRAPPGWQLYQDCKSYTEQSSGNTQLLKHTKQQQNPRLEAETKQSKVQKYLMLKVIKHWNNFTRWIPPSLESFKARGDVFFIQCCTSSRSQLRAVLWLALHRRSDWKITRASLTHNPGINTWEEFLVKSVKLLPFKSLPTASVLWSHNGKSIKEQGRWKREKTRSYWQNEGTVKDDGGLNIAPAPGWAGPVLDSWRSREAGCYWFHWYSLGVLCR